VRRVRWGTGGGLRTSAHPGRAVAGPAPARRRGISSSLTTPYPLLSLWLALRRRAIERKSKILAKTP